MDAVHIGPKLGLEYPGVHFSRFSERDVLGFLAGPSGGKFEDFASVARGVTGSALYGEGVTMAQLKAAQRFVPYQNLFYMNYLFDAADVSPRESIAEAFGAGKPKWRPIQ